MKRLLFVAVVIFISELNHAQCPFSATLTTTGYCPIADLTVKSANPVALIVWYKDGNPIDSIPFKYYPIKLIAGGNGQGAASNQLNYPDGEYVDANGNVYVSDAGNNRVQKFAPGSSTGVTVAGGNGTGSAANQLAFPRGLYVDAAGNLYVVDGNNNRVQKWAPGATSGVTVAGGNGAGASANQLNAPFGLFVNKTGDIYIADVANNRVQEWVPGATSGVTVAGGNGSGTAANQINGAISVFVDGSGNVFVADQNNNRIQEWKPGATVGITVAGGNGAGSAPNQLFDPVGVAVDASGNIFVADYINDRVQEWVPGATEGIIVAGSSLPNYTGSVFSRPTSLFLDDQGNIYIGVDGGGNSVQEWSPSINNTSLFTYTPEDFAPGNFYAKVTDIYGCTVTTNAFYIYGFSNPQITISSTTTTSTGSCSPLTFTAAATGVDVNATYQWQINGINKGANDSVFTYNNWHNGDIVQCVLTNNSACTVPTATAISNNITVNVTGQSSVSLAAKNGTCLGDTLFFSANDSLAQIIWYNGNSPVDTVFATDTASFGVTVAGGNGKGENANQFNQPDDIFFDAAGNMYIDDLVNARVQEFAPGSTTGITVAGGNGPGVTASQLSQPEGISVDTAGNIYIADNGNDRVQKWARGATTGITVAGGNMGGTAANQLNSPDDLFIDNSGYLYVTDAGNSRVQRFPPGSSNITNAVTVAGGNGAGSAANQLDGPEKIFVDNNKNVYVVDDRNNRVQKWVPGATSGITVAGGNGPGSAANQLFVPIGIYVDASGNIYVNDSGNDRIQKWAPDAKTGVTVAGGNGAGSGSNQMNYPEGIYVDPAGNIYIAEAGNDRIQKWAQKYRIDTTYKSVTAGTYTAVVTNSGGCVVTSNPVIINSNVNPKISISASDTVICRGGSVTFTATPFNGGTAPVYQWQVNGVNTGTNSPSFISGNLANGSVVTCILTSNSLCAPTPTDTSNAVTIRISNPVTPTIIISASQTNICPGAPVTFTANSVNGGTNPFYQWQINGINAGTDSSSFTSAAFADGDIVSCNLTSNAGCTNISSAGSNTFTIKINANTASVNIGASAIEICAGDNITFTATATATSGLISYQWKLNGIDEGTDNSQFASNHIENGDSVQCVIKDNSACSTVHSNIIVIAVDSLPVIKPEIISITPGQTITLNPSISGDISSFLWSPGTYLSDSTIQNPIATPAKNITYDLEVVSAAGCKGDGQISVKVFTKISVASAFSPNGDGHNDVFYVLGSEQGAVIKDFSVFSRWGEQVFHVHDVLPGDSHYGWDGKYKGLPAETGSYAYIITVTLANGSTEIYKGTVTLFR
jgi:gliding motility-associated-like protein